VTRRFVVPLDEHPDEVLFLPEASAGDWACILAHATLWSLESEDVLVRAGEADRTLWFLAEGTLNVVDGGGTVLKTVVAPSVVGEVAFLDGGPRSRGLVAAEPSEVARFGVEAFQALSAEDPDLACRFALELGRVTAMRLRAVEAASRA
jgi:CRP-like cAMP-binding protein